jgi:hypothetical protein
VLGYERASRSDHHITDVPDIDDDPPVNLDDPNNGSATNLVRAEERL